MKVEEKKKTLEMAFKKARSDTLFKKKLMLTGYLERYRRKLQDAFKEHPDGFANLNLKV